MLIQDAKSLANAQTPRNAIAENTCLVSFIFITSTTSSEYQKRTHHHTHSTNQHHPRLPPHFQPSCPITRSTNIRVLQRRILLRIIHSPTESTPTTQLARLCQLPPSILSIRIIHNQRICTRRQGCFLRILSSIPRECLWRGE